MGVELVVIERHIFVAGSQKTVLSFLANSALMAEWIAASHELDAKPGGLFRIQLNRGGTLRAAITQKCCRTAVWHSHGVGSQPSEGQNPNLTVLPPAASLVEIDLEPRK